MIDDYATKDQVAAVASGLRKHEEDCFTVSKETRSEVTALKVATAQLGTKLDGVSENILAISKAIRSADRLDSKTAATVRVLADNVDKAEARNAGIFNKVFEHITRLKDDTRPVLDAHRSAQRIDEKVAIQTRMSAGQKAGIGAGVGGGALALVAGLKWLMEQMG